MKTLTRDGQNIDSLIPGELRQMFYRNPNSQHKYAKRNGYSPYSFSVDGLVLYLPLWALKGDAFKSVDAFGHTCTVAGALWRPYGRYFDGTDDKINCGDHTAFDLTTAMTLEAWVSFVAAGSAEGIICRRDYAGDKNNYQFIKAADNKIAVYIFVSNAAKLSAHHTVLSTTTWYHCVVTYNNVTIETYVNTVVGTAPTSVTGTLDNDDTPLLIGARADALDLTGRIGEVRVYNRALSQVEITHNYNTTKWRYQ